MLILIISLEFNILVVSYRRVYGTVLNTFVLISLIFFLFWQLYLVSVHKFVVFDIDFFVFSCSGMESLGQEGKGHARLWRWWVQAYVVRGGCSNWEAHYFETWWGMERKAGALCRSIQLLQRATGSSEGSPRMKYIFLTSSSIIGIFWILMGI